MSYRPPKNVRRGKPAPMRGPSRPLDPRYAPGGRPRRSMDGFAISLLVVTGLGLLVLLLVFVTQNRNGTTIAGGGPTPPPNWTQTAVAFATQTNPNAVPRISLADAKALYDANNVTMIDVREPSFFTAGHIKGAISIPQVQVQTRLAEIPKTGNVVLYCQ